MNKSRIKKIAIGITVLVIGIIGAFVIWASYPMKAEEAVLSDVRLRDKTTIESTKKVISIKSKNSNPKVGIIFYPGARVQPEAYINKLTYVVEDNNIQIFITKPILNFAIFGISDAQKIISTNASISEWYIGGHSLGGAMACQFAENHQNELKGMILFGSFCAADLSKSNYRILSISGSEDGLSTKEKIDSAANKLPASTNFVTIQGANHASFGDYGIQPGDGEMKSTDENVRTRLREEITNFLSSNL